MSTYRVRLTGDWLPIPDAALTELGWTEGTPILVEVLGDTVIITRDPNPAPIEHPKAIANRAARIVPKQSTGPKHLDDGPPWEA